MADQSDSLDAVGQTESQWASWKGRSTDVESVNDKIDKMDIKDEKMAKVKEPSAKHTSSIFDTPEEKSDEKSMKGSRSAPPKGRGYQENRRYDRERRGKRNDKKSDSTASEESRARDRADSGGDVRQTESKGSRTDQRASGRTTTSPTKSSSDTKSQVGQKDSRPPRKSEQVPWDDRRGHDDKRSNDDSKRGYDDSRRSHGNSRKGYDDSKRSYDKDRDTSGSVRGKKAAGKDTESAADLLNLLHQPKEAKSSETTTKTPSNKIKSGKEAKVKVKSAADLEAQWQKEEEERKRKEEEEKRKEEEAKRKEEERIRREEEAKRKEEEDAQRLIEEEMKSIQDFIQETGERIRWKNVLREKNLKAIENRPDDSFFTKLDSNLKKNTAFVKKLKNITEGQKESLTKDFNGLNLTKYVGEAAAAITEAKLKMTDINCALHICSLLHQRYADFNPALMENWNKVLLSKKDDKVPNPSKLRVDLRFFSDLVTVGVFTQKEGLPMLANQLTLLISNDKDDHNNLTIILSFSKHCGDDYAGLLPRKFRLLAEKYNYEITRSKMLPAERQKACRNLLHDYFTSLCKHLVKEHAHLRNMEKQNRKTLQTKGELSTERKERQEAAHQAFQKLVANSQNYADLLDDDLPELPEEEYKIETDLMGCDIYQQAEYEYSGDSTLFEDEDTRQFYEHIPDLKAVIPGILYKDSEHAASIEDSHQDISMEEDLHDLDVEELEKVLTMEMEAQEQAQNQGPDSTEDQVKAAGADKQSPKAVSSDKPLEEGILDELDPDVTLDGEDDDTDVASSMKLILEAFLNGLSNCVNRELIDRAANDFCMNLNTKSNRKKLVKALFTVQRTRYDLLPFYARLVATLHPCMPDVAADLATLLKGDFRWHVRKKDQINIESKLKTVRFIGELVKFKMFPKAEGLHCLKMLMFDFSHHNIEMACALLETCGRFLYRCAESHHRTKVYLDVMMRKKVAFHFDQRYDTMIENAYYYSNPPEIKQEAKKIRPPMHEYVRKLLYKDLTKITIEKVLRQMRKLIWDEIELKLYVVKCLTNIWNVRYNSVHCCANLLAGLASYHEDVAIAVVDGILEDIRLGMEVNVPKYNQRRVSAVKFLGELYNYRMVESVVIFKTLYSFITFGVSLDESVISPLDPVEHLFRIRLTCVLLDTCGQYFDRGSSKKKLDYFLSYFLRYYYYKRKCSAWNTDHPFPMEVDYTVRDTIEAIRPKLTIPESYEEAATAVEEMEKELIAKLADVLPQFKMMEENMPETDLEGGLATIQESEELDDMSQGMSQVQMTDDTQGTQEDTQGTPYTQGTQDDTQGTQDNTQGTQDDTQGTQDNTQGTQGTQDSEHDDATGSQGNSRNRQRHHMDDDGEEGDEREDEEDSSDSEDVMESAGEEEAEDQVTLLTGGPKCITCPEDDDFMASFDKMLTDTIQARSQEAVKLAQVEITMPVHIRAQQKAKPPVVNFMGVAPSDPEEEEEEDDDDDDVMKFTLMTRRGNKAQFTALNIPVSENFASKFKEREEAKKAEKERMKKVVLDIHERQEEEDYQEMIASMSRPAMVNFNRERRVRYQHPKGAPDADLIFGSKKR